MPEHDGGPEARSLTLRRWSQDWMTFCLANNNRETEICSKRSSLDSHLLPALGRLPLDRIRPADIEALKVTMRKKGRRPATVKRVMAHLRACLNYAVRCELLDRNPMVAVAQVKVSRADQKWTWLDFEEADRLIEAAREEGPVGYATIVLALRTGLRRGELCGLKWDAVDLDNARLEVRLTRTVVRKPTRIVEGPPKSGKDRVVGLTAMAVDALRVLPSRFAGGYVLTEPDGEPVHPDHLRRAQDRSLKRAEIGRHVRPHDLRHTWASHLASRGVPLAVIQQLGGWASYSMVLRYAHLSRESVVREVDVLEGG